MRLDKFLKVSRIIKRRTVAADACTASRVTVNGKTAKPSCVLKVGDVLEISFGAKSMRVRVTALLESTKKADAAEMYEVLP